ncbi:MAG: bifunctional phosphopantothenoylcysteine decarboxylase/phosphopantothenate--cysteine ligase CoaBC, partial [Deltaproteobacteria bacterium]|nr:bifunctional phosphopantothenoylcysteine decarboxylase/phosphopantothenate--cysteine ligase CoaBC [Deltaproteobacteria bacterium]
MENKMSEEMKIVLGITGSIAVYKSCELIRLFRKEGITVIPVMTPDSKRFISPLLLESLAQNKVYSDMFDESGGTFYHIMLSRGANLILIAPATANTISKIASGMADNLLTSAVLASDCPVLIAPAMNVKMFENPLTQQNIKKLTEIKRFSFVMPESGELACGDTGTGRLADVQDIFDESMQYLTGDRILKGKKVLVSAGPTQEYMDAVRFLSNPSSGRMGYEIARTAKWLGAEVTLVTGPVSLRPPYGVKVIKVVSAEDMKNAVLKETGKYDLLIMNAAVSDWRFDKRRKQKIKRNGSDINIVLRENPDILSLASKSGKFRYIVGFAAESENMTENALIKMKKKDIDAIVVNDISRSDIGFGQESNEGRIIFGDGTMKDIERVSKRVMAFIILREIAKRLKWVKT